MLQEIKVFLTVYYAVKHGDIGLLRRMINPLIIIFLSADQTNYANEILYYWWLLTKGVCTPELQHLILASSLINWLGRENTHKPINLGLEHNNSKIKINIKCY
jgi:hypothetical protein